MTFLPLIRPFSKLTELYKGSYCITLIGYCFFILLTDYYCGVFTDNVVDSSQLAKRLKGSDPELIFYA